MTDDAAQPQGSTPAPTGGQPKPVAKTQTTSGAHPTANTPATPLKPVDLNARHGQLGTRGGQHYLVIPPHLNTQFDEENFLTLLEGSISLTLEEKNRVIEAIPRLSIEQINELIKIFVEEKQKFSELESEFGDDVAKLKKERETEIKMEENKQAESAEADEDAAAAAALRANLDL